MISELKFLQRMDSRKCRMKILRINLTARVVAIIVVYRGVSRGIGGQNHRPFGKFLQFLDMSLTVDTRGVARRVWAPSEKL